MKSIADSPDERIRNMTVVALTGNIAGEDTARYRVAGMHDVLAKPIDPERLRDVLLEIGGPRGADDAKASFSLSPEDLAEDSFSHSITYENKTVPTPESEPEIPAPLPATTAPASHKILDSDQLCDRNILGTLRASLGQKQLDEMMTGVFEHNDKVLPNLHAAMNDSDMDTVRALAHELKGMNGNFGLRVISTICARIEQGARHKNISADEMDELIFTDLPQAIQQTKAFLR